MADCSIQVIPSTFYAESRPCTHNAKDGNVPLALTLWTQNLVTPNLVLQAGLCPLKCTC